MDVLVEAERKYTAKLCDAMIPVMVDTFWEIWLEAKLKAKGQKVLQTYQELLREVKHNWSNTKVKKHVDDIIKNNSLFPNLLAAVMVCHVKILSAIRMDAKSKKISLKLPGNDIFVHTAYINAAKDIYDDPYIISDEAPPHKRLDELNKRFIKCIRDAIESLVPTEEILKTYIVMPDDTNLNINEDEPEVEAEPELSDDPLDPLGENPVPEDAPMAPEVQQIQEDQVEPAGSVNHPAETPGGTKTVAVTPSLTPPQVHKENLFDDAKE
jgi:Family of unknown function (DUF5764)